MLNQHTPSVIMMAVVLSPGRNESCPRDETLQYLLILCCKVTLNTIVLCFWKESILKSFMGICSLSMCVADMLMVGAIFSAWVLKEHVPITTSMCFILAHGSTIYALLPLPILIGGALDYASYPNLYITRSSPCRTVSYCVIVVLMWASAFVYTYFYTNTQPIEIYKDILRIHVCRVQGSTVVLHFIMLLSVAVGLILLLHFKQLIGWVRKVNTLSEKRNAAFLPNQDFPYSEDGECAHLEMEESYPPLFVSLTVGFAVNWVPYLLICLVCALIGFVVPSYASVNLLWMACANSVLVGIAFWFRSDRTGPFIKFPDDTCLWNIYWHLSHETSPTVDAKLATNLHVIVHKPMII